MKEVAISEFKAKCLGMLEEVRKTGKPIRVTVTKISAAGLYKIEVGDSLEAGEYSLSPADSNKVFCFQVF